MHWQPTHKERRRMQRRERIRTFREWLQAHQGFVPASWLHHTTGISKAAISLAIAQGRVRSAKWTCADGHTITLINLIDGDRLDVYRDAPGWLEDIDADAPPGQQRRRAARLGAARTPPEPIRGARGGEAARTRQKPSRGKSGGLMSSTPPRSEKTTPPRGGSGAASNGPT